MLYRELEQQYYDVEMPRIRKAIEDFKYEMGNEGKCMTLEALYEQLWKREDEILDRYNLYKSLSDEDAPYIEKAIVSHEIPILEKKKDELKMRIRMLVAYAEGKVKNTLTPEMIIRAREYPITELLGGSKRGNYLCINHAEKHPSMGVKNNRARCFSCGWAGDSIDTAMLLWNCDFIEAVKGLQGW